MENIQFTTTLSHAPYFSGGGRNGIQGGGAAGNVPGDELGRAELVDHLYDGPGERRPLLLLHPLPVVLVELHPRLPPDGRRRDRPSLPRKAT